MERASGDMVTFDPKEFRRACGQFLTGVTIVTVRASDGTPMGLTANSFTSVSLNPPLVLVCVDKGIGSYTAFRVGGTYAVHILGEDQADLSTRFASKGADKFGGLEWTEGLGGAPILPDYLTCMECRVVHAYEGGDHSILVGQVEWFTVRDQQRPPLGFFRGRYATMAQA